MEKRDLEADKIKLKFRVTAKDGPSGRWSEKWGVSLLPHEEFHITDQLLKLPFQEHQPVTVCTFSVPKGKLVFQMVDEDRVASVNGVRQKKAQLRLGDKVQIGEGVIIEVMVAPAFLKEVIEQSDGPTLITARPKSNSGSISIPAEHDEIPAIEGLQEPTLTLAPQEKERIAAEEKFRQEKAQQALEPEKKADLEEAPHPTKDPGINPDYIPEEADAHALKPLAEAKDPGFTEPKKESAPQPVAALEAKPIEESGDDARTRVVHAKDLAPASESMPLDEDRTVAYVRRPAADSALDEKPGDAEPVKRLKEALKPKAVQWSPNPEAAKASSAWAGTAEEKSTEKPTEKKANEKSQSAVLNKPVLSAHSQAMLEGRPSPDAIEIPENADAGDLAIERTGAFERPQQFRSERKSISPSEIAESPTYALEEIHHPGPPSNTRPRNEPVAVQKPAMIASPASKEAKAEKREKPKKEKKEPTSVGIAMASAAEQVKAKVEAALAAATAFKEKVEKGEVSAEVTGSQPWIPQSRDESTSSNGVASGASPLAIRAKQRRLAFVAAGVLTMIGAGYYYAQTNGLIGGSGENAPVADAGDDEASHDNDIVADIPPAAKAPVIAENEAPPAGSVPPPGMRPAAPSRASAGAGGLVIEPLKPGMSIEELRQQIQRLKSSPNRPARPR